MRKLSLLILILGLQFCSANVLAQTRRAASQKSDELHLIQKAKAAWPAFIAAFRAAARKHDREAIRAMLGGLYINPQTLILRKERSKWRNIFSLLCFC